MWRKPHHPAVFAPMDMPSENPCSTVSGEGTPREQLWILGWDESFLTGAHHGHRTLCRGGHSILLPCDSRHSGQAEPGSCPLAWGWALLLVLKAAQRLTESIRLERPLSPTIPSTAKTSPNPWH